MVCYLKNKSAITLFADLTDGSDKVLLPGQIFIYEDTITYPTEETWALVEQGLLEEMDHDQLWHDAAGLVTLGDMQTLLNERYTLVIAHFLLA